MTIIVALSGKKSSGKTFLANYLSAFVRYNRKAEMALSLYDKYILSQDEDGTVRMLDENSLPVALEDDTDKNKFTHEIVTKIYSFADDLKQFCVDVLGLKAELVYGTDQQKNTPTHIRWETMSMFIRWTNAGRKFDATGDRAFPEDNEQMMIQRMLDYQYKPILRTGSMTVREVLQVVGTDVFRNMFDDNIWVNATLRRIEKDAPKIAFIADLRFTSEAKAVLNNGGYIIRLLRSPFDKSDQHSSETSLDNYNWDRYIHSGQVFILDNKEMDLKKKNEITSKWLTDILVKKKS